MNKIEKIVIDVYNQGENYGLHKGIQYCQDALTILDKYPKKI